MNHSFDVKIAKQYGIQPAILLNHLCFWIEKNKANEQNFYDGHYWTYNSKKAFAALFPYMTARQIDYAMKKLIDEGLVITGNYNKSAYDRTLWYAITSKGFSILQNCEMEKTEMSNAADEIVKPIPDINITNINTGINTSKKVSKKESNAETEKSVVEVSNVKKSKRESFDEIIERYANGNERLELLLKQLLQIRFAKKRVTTNVVLNQLLDKLSELARSDKAKIKVLENSILKGYADLYELSKEESEEIHWLELREMQMERPEEWEAYMQFLKKPIKERSELLKHHPEWKLIDPEAEEINEISKNRHRKGTEEY